MDLTIDGEGSIPLLSRGGVARSAGVVLVKESVLLTSTTPAPPRLRRGADRALQRGIRVCGKRVEGLVPRRIDRRVRRAADPNIVRRSRICQILQSSQSDVVQHGV